MDIVNEAWTGGSRGGPSAEARTGTPSVDDANPDIVLFDRREGGASALLDVGAGEPPVTASRVTLEVEWTPTEGRRQACWWLTASVEGYGDGAARSSRSVLASGGGIEGLGAVVAAVCRTGLSWSDPADGGAQARDVEVWDALTQVRGREDGHAETGRIDAYRDVGRTVVTARMLERDPEAPQAWCLAMPADRKVLEDACRAYHRMMHARDRLAEDAEDAAARAAG